METLLITYQGESYSLHYAGDQVYYLRTSTGEVVEYDSISPRLMELCEAAIAYAN